MGFKWWSSDVTPDLILKALLSLLEEGGGRYLPEMHVTFP